MSLNLKKLFVLAFLVLFFIKPVHASLFHATTIPQNTGVNIHFLDKNLDDHIALLKEAGFGWVRKDLDWGGIEKQKGVYDFSKYDSLVDALNSAGISVVLILDYRNPLYDDNLSPYTYEGRQGFANFAAAAANHFANKKVVWEIYNEPNWSFWRPRPHVDNYIALARIVTQKLRQAAPHQAIIAPALAGPTQEADKVDGQYLYLKKVLNDPVAKKWDAISVHPYRGQRPPEDILRDIPRLNKLLASKGIKAPVIFTEWGYHTSDKGINEDTQAAYVVRSFLIASSVRMPFSIWYNWQELGDDSNDAQQKYGLIRDGSVDASDDDTKKPAFFALKQLNTLLAGYRYDKTLHNSNGMFCIRFKKGSDVAYAAWTTTKNSAPYQLALPKGQWRTKEIMGNANIIAVNDIHPATLQLQSMPLIVMPVSN